MEAAQEAQMLKVATKRKWSYHESILQRHQRGSKPTHALPILWIN